MIRALLVGGPEDGCYMVLASKVREVRLGLVSRFAGPCGREVVPIDLPMVIPTRIYYLTKLHPLPEDMAIYCHASVPPTEILVRLWAGYHPQASEADNTDDAA